MSKMGRPRLAKADKRGEYVSTRVSIAEAKEITDAAKRSGKPKTKWIRESLLAVARNRVT